MESTSFTLAAFSETDISQIEKDDSLHTSIGETPIDDQYTPIFNNESKRIDTEKLELFPIQTELNTPIPYSAQPEFSSTSKQEEPVEGKGYCKRIVLNYFSGER